MSNFGQLYCVEYDANINALVFFDVSTQLTL